MKKLLTALLILISCNAFAGRTKVYHDSEGSSFAVTDSGILKCYELKQADSNKYAVFNWFLVGKNGRDQRSGYFKMPYDKVYMSLPFDNKEQQYYDFVMNKLQSK